MSEATPNLFDLLANTIGPGPFKCAYCAERDWAIQVGAVMTESPEEGPTDTDIREITLVCNSCNNNTLKMAYNLNEEHQHDSLGSSDDWISVKDEVPKISDFDNGDEEDEGLSMMLVACDRGPYHTYRLAYYDFDEDYNPKWFNHMYEDMYGPEDVTHWMPLPKAPKRDTLGRGKV
jgi:hypothetical protein